MNWLIRPMTGTDVVFWAFLKEQGVSEYNEFPSYEPPIILPLKGPVVQLHSAGLERTITIGDKDQCRTESKQNSTHPLLLLTS